MVLSMSIQEVYFITRNICQLLSMSIQEVYFITRKICQGMRQLKRNQSTWKWRVRLMENNKITLSVVSKASLSLASLLLWVAHAPCWTESSRFSRLQLLTIKYLVSFSYFKKKKTEAVQSHIRDNKMFIYISTKQP